MIVLSLKKSVLLFSLCLSIVCFSQKQTKIDSLTRKLETASPQERSEILNSLAELNLKISIEKAEAFANEAEALSEKIKNPVEEARALKIKSSCYLNRYRYDDAVEATNKALDIYLKNEKLKDATNAYVQLGLIYKQSLDYSKSLENYKKAFEYFVLLKDSAGIAATNNLLGSLYFKQTNYPDALKYYHTSLQLSELRHDSAGIATSHYDIALVLREIGNFKEAIQHLETTISIYKKLNNADEEANALNLMGSVYLKMSAYDKALDYYFKSNAIREELGNKTDIASSYISLGSAYKSMNNLPKALNYLTKALDIQKETGDKKAEAISNNLIGGLYWASKDYNRALEKYLAFLKMSIELEEKTETATAYTNIGTVYFDLSNYDKSLEYFSEALVISGDINDNNRIANTYLLIGNSYSKQHKYKDALDNFTKALAIRRKLGEMAFIANALNSIGGTYSDMGNFNKALAYYNEALSIREKINDKLGISNSLNNLGNLYGAMNNQNQALSYFERSMKTAEEIGYKYSIALCARKIGEIYISFKNYDKAFDYFKKSIALGTELSNLELLKKGYLDIYNYYQLKGDYKNALANFISFTQYSDSIDISMTNKKLLDLQVNFELRKKESEVANIEKDIAALKKQKLIDELKDVRRNQTIFILLIVTIFLLAIGILYYNRYQLKRRAAQLLQDKYDIIDETNQSLKKNEEELLKLNSTKDKFFSIMAHDIKNPLGGLISITDLMKTDFKQTSDDEKQEMFTIINKSAQQLYSLLENLLHWSRSQTGKIAYNPIKIKPFELAETNIELLKANTEKKNIMIINLIDHASEIIADKDMITLVIRNLLSNAIKFTKDSGKIVIGSERKDGMLNIFVEDNGVGISKEDIRKLFRIDVHFSNAGTNSETGTGLGLILCNEFIQKHNGQIWVESEIGKGSKFIFSLPG